MIIWIFFIAFVLSWAIARFVRRRAISIYQRKNKEAQTTPVRILPDGAGLSIVITALCSFSYLAAFTRFMPFEVFMAIVPPGLFLVVAILVDEKYHFRPIYRYVVHGAVVAFTMYMLGGVNTLRIADFVWDTPVSHIVMNVFALVFLTWLINVFRFFDGIDGKEGNLAAVCVAICAGASLVLPKYNLFFFLIPCVAGFLVRNWYPARYLMGDATASFLGFVFGALGVYGQSGNLALDADPMSLLEFLILCFVPIFDVTYTWLRRVVADDNFMVPTKNHLYQRLLYSGLSHTKVILSQIALCAAMLVLLLIYNFFNDFSVAMFLLVDAFIIMGIYAMWVESRYAYVKESK